MTNKPVFRTSNARRPCTCGKCAKVAAILASPAGAGLHRGGSARALPGRAIPATVEAVWRARAPAEPPDGYDLAGLAAARGSAATIDDSYGIAPRRRAV